MQSIVQPTYQDKSTSPMPNWKDEIKWDLEDMISLRMALRHWVAMGITASIIGEYLVHILFNRDYHLENRITWMARANFPYVTIGLDILQFLQIRGEAGSPFWIPGHVILGNVHACPGGTATYYAPAYEMVIPHAGGFDGSASINKAVDAPSNSTTADEIVTPPAAGAGGLELLTAAVYVPPPEEKKTIPAPKPVRPFEAASFLGESDVHFLTKPLPFRTDAGIKAYIEALKNPGPTIAERRAMKKAALARAAAEEEEEEL
ncbi:hypothetical protein N7493_003194 [Penicillium malachiteum]|uniref:Uncharacterized protein n=1 Tax=Penicillium malachiteum TaxID=1324776 RepID=A0AAD6HT99_9EURO|nr:hypothetical protein N7493_003194 [Penicillium malachiteum]